MQTIGALGCFALMVVHDSLRYPNVGCHLVDTGSWMLSFVVRRGRHLLLVQRLARQTPSIMSRSWVPDVNVNVNVSVNTLGFLHFRRIKALKLDDAIASRMFLTP